MPLHAPVSSSRRLEQQALFNDQISATAWFYENDVGERVGPITANKFLDLLFSDTIGVDTLVWRPGLNDWVRAGTLAELRAHFTQGPAWRDDGPAQTATPATTWSRLLSRLFDRR